MGVKPDAQRFLDLLAAEPPAGPGAEPLPIAEQRRLADEALAQAGPFDSVGAVRELKVTGAVGSLAARAFIPAGRGPFPVLLWLHGGGWTVGSSAECEPICRALCRGARTIVVAVNYRRAPEHRFPSAVEDAYAALCWAAQSAGGLGGNGSCLAVGGESAGGNLAAAVSLMAADRGTPTLALQALVCPVLAEPRYGHGSYREFAEGFFLTAEEMRTSFELYPRDPTDLRNPYLVPLVAKDLKGAPPALILTAECDVLRDEGEAYAAKLRSAGVQCELHRGRGQIHGYFVLHEGQQQPVKAAELQARLVPALRAAFASCEVDATAADGV